MVDRPPGAAAGAAVTINGSALKTVCMGDGAGCAALLVFFLCLLSSKLTSFGGLEPLVKGSTPGAQQSNINDVNIGNNDCLHDE